MSNSVKRQASLSFKDIAVLTQGLMLALLILTILSSLRLGLQVQALIYPASVFLGLLFVWSVWSWRHLTGSLFDPYVLFFVAAVMFNGGQALLEIFHLNETGILAGKFSPETTGEAVILVSLGLGSFHLGALVSAIVARKRYRTKSVKKDPTPRLLQSARLVGWALLLISGIPASLLLKEAISVVLTSGYFALYQRSAATGFMAAPRVLAAFLIPGALFLLVGSKGRRIGILVSAVCVFVYSLLQFFLGSRSAAVMPLLVYAWLWHRQIRPLPKVLVIAGGAAVLFVLLPLIQAVRNTAGVDRLSPAYLMEAFISIENPVVVIVSEMGTSMMTVAYTLELVPSMRHFDVGLGYLYAFLTLVPNLFWEIHPTIARGLAGDWLVWTVAPGYAALGGGFGFSFIAEAYLNFGWIGTPLALGFMGFWVGRFLLWARRSNEPAKMATVASFFAFFFIFARGEAGTVIRPLIWYALLPYLLVLFVSRLRGSLHEPGSYPRIPFRPNA